MWALLSECKGSGMLILQGSHPNIIVLHLVSVPSLLNSLYRSLYQEILNHCFDDIELFMGKLQKSAEAHSVLSQRSKKKKKSRKKDAEGKRQEGREGEHEDPRACQRTKQSSYSVNVYLWGRQLSNRRQIIHIKTVTGLHFGIEKQIPGTEAFFIPCVVFILCTNPMFTGWKMTRPCQAPCDKASSLNVQL